MKVATTSIGVGGEIVIYLHAIVRPIAVLGRECAPGPLSGEG
jgi:hypothetical protein